MRIAYVTRQLPPEGVGGIGRYVETVARLMAEAGHDVTIVSAAPGHRRSTTRVGPVTVERFPAAGPRRLWAALSRRSFLAASRLHGAVSALVALRRLDGSFDVVEAPEWKAEGLLLRWCRARAVVVHLHLAQELVRRWNGPGQRRGRGAALAEWLEARTVRSAQAATATSEMTRTFPDGSTWLPEVPVVRVPPPLDAARWSDCPPVSATAPVVLFLGHLERRKAPEVLLEALGLLRDDVDGLRAVLAGRSFDGPDGIRSDEVLAAAADRLGLDCTILPPCDHGGVRELYAAARVVVVPSRFETLSMVAMEGLASGRPVVVTDAVGAAEWIRTAVPELVVPPLDPTALAAALRPLLLDADEAQRVGQRGQAAVLSACSSETIVAARLAVYDAALDGRRS